MSNEVDQEFLSLQNIDINKSVPPKSHLVDEAHVQGIDQYKRLYKESIEDSVGFWDRMAKELLTWYYPYYNVCNVDLKKKGNLIPPDGNISWFMGGKLNACYNAVDRHVNTNRADKIAIIHEGNEVGNTKSITYSQLLVEVCKVANALKSLGVKKGDVVSIYMPMVPEAIYSILACARIGAVSNVVFAGFSSEALAARIQDGKSQIILTATQVCRGEKRISLIPVLHDAVLSCPLVKNIVILNYSDDSPKIQEESFSYPLCIHDFKSLVDNQRPCCPCEWMDSEDELFVLYTSGSTGNPKGVLHTTGGYCVFASITHKYIFDVHENDIHACIADIGWITGHTYIVWGPLLNGTTTLIFESIPTYPGPDRYWELIQRHKITLFYTAPTAIRTLMRYGLNPLKNYDLSSLRILGSVGEPINKTAWEWYYEAVGKENCAIVDTYWMTESGGIMMSPLPGVTSMKPGSCCHPFFGVEPKLIDHSNGHVIESNNKKGVLCFNRPWPGMTRTVRGYHNRFIDTYLKPYPGYFFTGDGAFRDNDGYYWITGRVDDVINVSGHRLGTAELESALVSHISCAEAAVVGVAHDVKGQAIHAFCVLKHGFEFSHDLPGELCSTIRRHIGGIAIPDRVYIVPGLPKTRSGKIMRRILRKIASGEHGSLGDTSTVAEPHIVENIIEITKKVNGK